MRSKSSRVSSMPSRPAMASRWIDGVGGAAHRGQRDDRVQERARGSGSCWAAGPRAPSRWPEPARLVGGLQQAAVRRRGPGDARASSCRAPRPPAPSSRPCPSCCSGRGCGSSRTPSAGSPRCESVPARTSSDSFHTSVPQPSGHAAEGAAEHRPARQHDRRKVDRGRRHQQRRDRLVAAAEQHQRRRSGWRGTSPRRPSPPCCATASRSGGRCVSPSETTGRFMRDAAGLVDALLDALGDLVEVGVARRQVRGGVGDRDVRPSVEGMVGQPAPHPRPMDVGVAVGSGIPL